MIVLQNGINLATMMVAGVVSLCRLCGSCLGLGVWGIRIAYVTKEPVKLVILPSSKSSLLFFLFFEIIFAHSRHVRLNCLAQGVCFIITDSWLFFHFSVPPFFTAITIQHRKEFAPEEEGSLKGRLRIQMCCRRQGDHMRSVIAEDTIKLYI